MAFSTSNVQRTVWGNMRIMYGQWTGAVGDAPGTITVSGGQLWLSVFNTNLSTGPQQVPSLVSEGPTGTTGILTLTIPNQNTVTAGTFMVVTS